MAYYRMTDAEARQFHEDGYLLVRMFDDEEIELLRQACANDPALDTHSIQLSDGDGGKSDITLWNNPADDLYAGRELRLPLGQQGGRPAADLAGYHTDRAWQRHFPRRVAEGLSDAGEAAQGRRGVLPASERRAACRAEYGGTAVLGAVVVQDVQRLVGERHVVSAAGFHPTGGNP